MAELFDALLAHTADAVLLTRTDGAILRANPAACRVLGRSEEEIRRAGRAGLIAPDPRLEPLLAERERASTVQGELRMLRPDGSSFPAELTSTILSLPGGDRVTLTVFRDVSEQRRLAAELRESEERLRLFVQHAPAAIAMLDREMRYLAVSRRWLVDYGLGDQDLRGRTHYEVFPEVPERWKEIHRRCLAGAVEKCDEDPFPREGGGLDWVRWEIHPWRAGGGEIGGIVMFTEVITERKEAELALRRSEEALQRSDQRKSEFLAVLSHELRNPLAPIRNSVYLLEHAAPGSAQQQRAKEVIRRQTQHLARLVDDLLDVTRISRGKVELSPGRFDLREVVRRVSDDLRTVFEQGQVDVRHDLPGAAVWVDADATRLEQVLGNLLRNAVKFTPAGGSVVVSVELRDGRVELAVRDNGVGIDPAELDRVFEPFVQADRSLARSQGGLGLGLALVKGLVELHGGAVHARSGGPGHGAEFVVTLPLAPPPPSAAPEAPSAGAVAGRVVLVVEDNVDARQVLADVLELNGYTVHSARDGRSGIALARELRPDVVLCDIGLPDLDGYEVARTLRGDAALAATRLVALSGYAQSEDRQRARQAGFDAHVAKPASLAQLVDVLAPEGGLGLRGEPDRWHAAEPRPPAPEHLPR